MEQALEVYEIARKYDPTNKQLEEMAEKCAQDLLVNDKGYGKGAMPFGDLFMKGYGREEQNPLGLGGLAKAESDPKVAKWLKDDIMFRNQFDMLKHNPNMILQLMGTDPRWMEVFKILTGVDLGAFGEAKRAEQEENAKREAELKEKMEQQEREREEQRKRQEFESLPDDKK